MKAELSISQELLDIQYTLLHSPPYALNSFFLLKLYFCYII